jgi:hypothetical protein
VEVLWRRVLPQRIGPLANLLVAVPEEVRRSLQDGSGGRRATAATQCSREACEEAFVAVGVERLQHAPSGFDPPLPQECDDLLQDLPVRGGFFREPLEMHVQIPHLPQSSGYPSQVSLVAFGALGQKV